MAFEVWQQRLRSLDAQVQFYGSIIHDLEQEASGIRAIGSRCRWCVDLAGFSAIGADKRRWRLSGSGRIDGPEPLQRPLQVVRLRTVKTRQQVGLRIGTRWKVKPRLVREQCCQVRRHERRPAPGCLLDGGSTSCCACPGADASTEGFIPMRSCAISPR